MGKAVVKAEQNGGVIVLESIPKMNGQTKPYFDLVQLSVLLQDTVHILKI